MLIMINKLMVTLIGVRPAQKDSDELFSLLSKLSRENSLLLQVFNPDSVISKKHIEHAYELSKRAFASKTNIARTMQAELLLRAAGSSKINKAIERVGIENPNRILLFSPKRIPKSVIEQLGKEDPSLLKTSVEKEKNIAQLFGVKASKLYSLEELVLERIALME